jgi:hypothetical protein
VITDYASLQTAVGNWLNKGGSTLFTARIPEFIQLAEARFRRKLDDLDQDIITTVSITDGIGTLPADFGALKEISADFDDPLVVYSIVAGQIQTDPVETGAATIVYKQALPALSNTVTSNWLLARAPDIYLYGSLVQAEFFGWNDERLPLIKAALDEALEELRVDSDARRWGPAPLGPSIKRT